MMFDDIRSYLILSPCLNRPLAVITPSVGTDQWIDLFNELNPRTRLITLHSVAKVFGVQD